MCAAGLVPYPERANLAAIERFKHANCVVARSGGMFPAARSEHSIDAMLWIGDEPIAGSAWLM